MQRVAREADGVRLQTRAGHAEHFDHVVLACHSDQSLALLSDADAGERAVLEGVRYERNRAVLHTDTALMPALKRVWSAWNYMSDGGADPNVSVTYLLNRLQPLPFDTPLMVSLNPVTEPRHDAVLAAVHVALRG